MIKVAVIGIGSMGRHHARVFTELSETRLVAVADSNLPSALNVAGLYGIPAYDDYQRMLIETQPEAVSIAVPTAFHEGVTLTALEAGAHVLVEKPISATMEEGQRMVARAQALHRQLMVGHVVRFNPAVQLLKKKLQDGVLGRIFQIISRRVGPFPARIRDVGVVIDLATHDLDLMRYLTGLEPMRVFSETEYRISTDLEDLLLGLLRFPGGITGALEINWLTPTKAREVFVLGERGLFKVDDLTQDLFFYENAYEDGNTWSALQTFKGVSEGSMTRYAFQRYEPLKAELNAFISAVKEGTPVPVSGVDGLAALRLALALVESGKTHQVIRISDEAGISQG
jgi:UDP-N-acetylglucosamine 3-dehydrogenase